MADPRSQVNQPIWVVGIDPGLQGAYAVLDQTGNPKTYGPLPRKKPLKLKLIDVDQLANQLMEVLDDGWVGARVYLEHVTPYANGSKKSAFTFGSVFGQLQTFIQMMSWPGTLVYPTTWQPRMLGKLKPKQTKARSLEKVKELWGIQTSDDGISDALLIARYGWEMEVQCG